MILALIGNPTRTNLALTRAWRSLGLDARVLSPGEALVGLGPGDTAIARLDVLPTLDGVEPGLPLVGLLEEQGVRVLNRPDALLAAHDKLETARRLEAADVPHPWTAHLDRGGAGVPLRFPCVIKPRFGSWGQDVYRCRTPAELARCLDCIDDRAWWRMQGALVQELVEPVACDLRLVVAGDRVVAAARRVAAAGEWRTNVTLGGRIAPAELPAGTRELAVRAAQALEIDLVGVDLLPVKESWTVLELNGAVDFDATYTLPGVDPYAEIVRALGIATRDLPGGGREERKREREEIVMTKTCQGTPVRPGDEIVITGHSVGDAPRTALVLEVLGEPGRERYRVRWEDDHESIFFPGEDAIVHRPESRKRTKSTA